jgi:hypothetical protein
MVIELMVAGENGAVIHRALVQDGYTHVVAFPTGQFPVVSQIYLTGRTTPDPYIVPGSDADEA